jgi:hypothetical protein
MVSFAGTSSSLCYWDKTVDGAWSEFLDANVSSSTSQLLLAKKITTLPFLKKEEHTCTLNHIASICFDSSWAICGSTHGMLW